MLSPFSFLLIIAQSVSNIGITSTHIGIIIEDAKAVLNPKRVMTDMINPKNIEPVSPINILAGWKLWIRKPAVDPNIIKAIMNARLLIPLKYEIMAIVKKKIEAIPPARPSKPSIKFIQFIQPSIKNKVIG